MLKKFRIVGFCIHFKENISSFRDKTWVNSNIFSFLLLQKDFSLMQNCFLNFCLVFLWQWCKTIEEFSEIRIVKNSAWVVCIVFYDSKSNIEVLSTFWISLCVRHEIGIQFHFYRWLTIYLNTISVLHLMFLAFLS